MQIKIVFISIVADIIYNTAAGLLPKCNTKVKIENHNNSIFEFANDDSYMNTSQLIAKYGHPVEEYSVTTEDGYILNMVRIPNSGPVVFMMLSLVCISDDWVTNGPHTALPYLLSNANYDIWLGNARDNKYTKRHVRLSPGKEQFWEYSWHEIGYYDLPAMIDFALATSKRSQLVYIGHSQGTTSFFVLCSERSEYNKKISLVFSLSTVVYVWTTITTLAPFAGIEYALAQTTGFYELFTAENFEFMSSVQCDVSEKTRLACATLWFTLFGFDYKQLKKDQLSVQLPHFPSGSSVRQFVHYFQNYNTKKFAKYDYSHRRNLELYGSLQPPHYPVERITVPISIFYSTNDFLSSFEDVKILIAELPNVVDVHRVGFPLFNHLDYSLAKDAKRLVYQRVLTMINKLFKN